MHPGVPSGSWQREPAAGCRFEAKQPPRSSFSSWKICNTKSILRRSQKPISEIWNSESTKVLQSETYWAKAQLVISVLLHSGAKCSPAKNALPLFNICNSAPYWDIAACTRPGQFIRSGDPTQQSQLPVVPRLWLYLASILAMLKDAESFIFNSTATYQVTKSTQLCWTPSSRQHMTRDVNIAQIWPMAPFHEAQPTTISIATRQLTICSVSLLQPTCQVSIYFGPRICLFVQRF